jgi:opacity protein-like surface antigen
MKQVILCICVLVLATSTASAREVNGNGAYVGGAAGFAYLDDDDAFSGLNFDNSDVSLEIFGGYKIFRYFAVEARLTHLGSYRLESTEIDTKAYSLHAVGIVPFGESGWELFGQLGLGRINLDAGGIDDEDETAGSAGIGMRFTPDRNKNLSIAFRIDAYAWEDDSFDQNLDVSIITTKFALQYNF